MENTLWSKNKLRCFCQYLPITRKIAWFDLNFGVPRKLYHIMFMLCLKAVIMLHELFLAKPVPVDEHCQDARWKWFLGFLGALDGTYINVLVDTEDKPRFWSRKGQIATNTMIVCTRDMRFVYVLAGWEGSAGDARVLRDAVTREHGLKVPRGQYYLCDNGYANSEGFLTPFKGVRYHLKEWGPHAMMPQNPREMYNMRHTKARNVIDRVFAVVKMRWGILRSASYYPINIQVELILSCFLLHNFIRGQMTVDPIELELDGHHIGIYKRRCQRKMFTSTR
ncbi:putative nuclease HARBI1 [Salvia splendens]|uniref:putative nuclease HARBI1 n=1 Tax=Salvia splendens TaxID=180675 RepID=UPI001C277DE0|nr:putative nuclease HARBI1 [Salvia splendens]XP_042024483.1 putative nuclease HARBI1 [Salvia splendens]